MKSDNEEDISLEDVMTKGIERASLVIVAVTRQYKLNPSAFAGKVDIIKSQSKKLSGWQ